MESHLPQNRDRRYWDSRSNAGVAVLNSSLSTSTSKAAFNAQESFIFPERFDGQFELVEA